MDDHTDCSMRIYRIEGALIKHERALSRYRSCTSVRWGSVCPRELGNLRARKLRFRGVSWTPSSVLMALPSLRTVDPGRERLRRVSREDWSETAPLPGPGEGLT